MGRDASDQRPGADRGTERGAAGAAQPVRIVRAVRAEIGLQQREPHQVELRVAAADALEFAGDRFQRVDRGGEIPPFERGEACDTAGTQGPDG